MLCHTGESVEHYPRVIRLTQKIESLVRLLLFNKSKNGKREINHRYNDEQKITEFGRASISEALSNFSCSSAFPMTFAAWLICRMSSCSRLNTRMSEPSNWSVSCQGEVESSVLHETTVRRVTKAYGLPCIYPRRMHLYTTVRRHP